MTYYITPFARRRRMLERMMDPEWPNYEPEVIVPVDVKAEADDYIITALIPGVKAEDLNIQVVNETVSIQGELHNDREEGASYLLEERPAGKFCRTVTLPEPMNSTKAEASLKDGILVLRVPKAEEAKPKSIKVSYK